jgi:hypothetical protein
MRQKIFLLFLLSFACISLCSSAPIEEKNGKTIITLKVPNLPDPASKNIHARATLKALELFKQDFPKIFAKKYKAKYKANPEKYGNYNWDNVEINIVDVLEPISKVTKLTKLFLAQKMLQMYSTSIFENHAITSETASFCH